MNSSEAYELIYKSLGAWLEAALADGFEDNPMGKSEIADAYVQELILLADAMAFLESYIAAHNPGAGK